MPKSKTDGWFKTWFNTKHYLELYKHRDNNDAGKIVSLINKNIPLPKGAKVLDLACGNGRHSILFARKGFNVLGIDLSPYLISEAKKKLKSDYFSHKNSLTFEIKDMRKITHKNEFDLVVNLFSSFGYFERDSENWRVIKSVSDSLQKGGYFFFDFLNEVYVKKTLVPFDIKKRNRNVIIQVREVTGGFVKKNIIIIQNAPRAEYPVISNFHEKVKLYSLKDFTKVFKHNKLKIIKTFGSYTGSKFNPKTSERLIILAEKG